MRKKLRLYGLLLPLILSAACSPVIAADAAQQSQKPANATEITSAVPTQDAPDFCPVTRPPEPPFVPPEPYPSEAPYGQFWYGDNGLWTALHPDGRWYALPHGANGYSQKVFWWREGYDMTHEPQPQIVVTTRRLDGDAPTFVTERGTNGYHADMGQFMLTGVEIPSAGCWEIIATYGNHTLSFAVSVEP